MPTTTSRQSPSIHLPVSRAVPAPTTKTTTKTAPTKFQQECLDALRHFGGTAALGDLAAKVRASPTAIQSSMRLLQLRGVVTHQRRVWSMA